MSQSYNEILAAAWPEHPVRVFRWDNQNQKWLEAMPWDPQDPQLHREGILGDPLPLLIICTESGSWIVPATDGRVWWWTKQSVRPDRIPLIEAEIE
ncbi:hypothetical protein SAMN00768000_0238 [Sulfobacillus thermosulfidooxidans DSM 9293]|uniref:Uncharacterized protein n=1 Tax=Sulfobacillus thermosulfidooxidans (strain DSM 9293 / VKM B-1269 / AT-1) TaxID=929705 RepID=A0A1W1W6X3_SULTA|nr:hypothetical protein [Sulfobacillus thermosulfidooxidans]SMC02028.1 hypothetical protein SAMN00768000_0238 [Sulfobacillus thermosulfidooxidans DSM 9293]